eukprot:8526820-Pyramimonas_sp.AAC.1
MHPGVAILGSGHDKLPLLTRGLRQITRGPEREHLGSQHTNFLSNREGSIEPLRLLGARLLVS